MKCAKCGEDIKPGNLYCSKCGEEVQIVSAYNVMEDEFFLDFQNHEMDDTPLRSVADSGAILQKKNFYLSVLTAIIGFLILLVIAFLVRIHINNAGAEDAPDHYVPFIQALSDSDEPKAVTCLEQGLSHDQDELSGQFWLAWLYGEQGKQEEQIDTLKHILTIDNENVYACRELIRVYVEADEFEKLYALYDMYDGTGLAALFTDYLVETPVIELPTEPVWDGDTLTITAADGLNIYYTLDGSSPITNGILYYAPIRLGAGEFTLQASACNEEGYYSMIVSEELTVEKHHSLGMPQITPNSGEYLTPQTIYVTVPEGCSAYYTWNGSDPTTASNKYSGGISMPEGNNVLSVILADPYGNVSSIQRVNYIYMPQ